MFVWTISRTSSNMGHVGSKTRSPGQILGNSCLHSRGQICDPILMKFGQNVRFYNILARFENMSCLVKKLGHQGKSEEILVYTLDATFVTRF